MSTPLGLYTVDAETGNISSQMNESNATLVCPVGTVGQGGVTGTRALCCPQLSKGLLHFWRLNAVSGVAESSGNPVYKCSAPEKVSALVFSSCGGLMFAGTPTGTVYVWQTWTGALLKSWTAHFGTITSMRMSEDDSHLFTASEDATIKGYFLPSVFDPESKSPVPVPAVSFTGHSGPVTESIISGDLLISASKDCSVKIFEWKVAKSQIAQFLLPSVPTKLAVNHTVSEVVVGCVDGSVHACNVEDGSVTPFLSAHTSSVAGVAATLDCGRIVTCAADGLKIWDVASRVLLQSVMGPSQQLKNAQGILMMRKSPLLPDGSVDHRTRLVSALDSYLQFKPLQRILVPIETIDTVPLIRVPVAGGIASKVRTGVRIDKDTVEGGISTSKEDTVARLQLELAKQKEITRVYAATCADLYSRLAATTLEGDVELRIPALETPTLDDPSGKKRKNRK